MKDFLKNLNQSFSRVHITVISGLMLLVGWMQHIWGRPFWPDDTGGKIATWRPDGNYNSQLLADPYTFSHFIHGFIFFYFFQWVSKRWQLNWTRGTMLILATITELAWELWENTPFIIEMYRRQTASTNYYGDSIINSASDTVAMIIGFFLAARLPLKYILLLVLFLELLALALVRDNLTLNILMLIYPIEAIKRWQMGLLPPKF